VSQILKEPAGTPFLDPRDAGSTGPTGPSGPTGAPGAAAQAVNTALAVIDVKFVEPVYVNPGEFVAVAKKYYGTVGTAGVIQNLITIDYGWE